MNFVREVNDVKKKERIVEVVDDHFELPKKYLNMTTEEIDRLILEEKKKQKEAEEIFLQKMKAAEDSVQHGEYMTSDQARKYLLDD